VGPESSMARLAAARLLMCLDRSACFRWRKAALMSTSLVCSLRGKLSRQFPVPSRTELGQSCKILLLHLDYEDSVPIAFAGSFFL
jgi:hypothetical protein